MFYLVGDLQLKAFFGGIRVQESLLLCGMLQMLCSVTGTCPHSPDLPPRLLCHAATSEGASAGRLPATSPPTAGPLLCLLHLLLQPPCGTAAATASDWQPTCCWACWWPLGLRCCCAASCASCGCSSAAQRAQQAQQAVAPPRQQLPAGRPASCGACPCVAGHRRLHSSRPNSTSSRGSRGLPRPA